MWLAAYLFRVPPSTSGCLLRKLFAQRRIKTRPALSLHGAMHLRFFTTIFSNILRTPDNTISFFLLEVPQQTTKFLSKF